MFSLLVEALPSGRIIASGIPLTPPTVKLETGKAWACEIEIPAAAQAQGIHASSLPEWGCALWIDNGSRIVGGGILLEAPTITSDGDFKCICGGFLAYPVGQSWNQPRFDGVKIPIEDAIRKIWGYLTRPGGLSVKINIDKCGLTVGKEEKHVEFTTSSGEDVGFDAGPWRLNPWQTTDLGKTLEDLVKIGGYCPGESHQLDQDTGLMRHEISYKLTRGLRRQDISLIVGRNVHPVPELSGGLPYASEIYCIGAGEGDRTVISATLSRHTTGLRRCVSVSDKSADSATKALRTAREELAARRGGTKVKTFTVFDSPQLPLFMLHPGDEVQVIGDSEWGSLDQWVTIKSISWQLESDTATIEVEVPGTEGGY